MHHENTYAIGPVHLLTLLTAVAALAVPAVAEDGARTGEQIYRQTCAACHGDSGEGSEDFPRALAGDRSVAQLSGYIAKSMPDDDPGTCTGEDADKVAA